MSRFTALLAVDPTGDETSQQQWSEFQTSGTVRTPFPRKEMRGLNRSRRALPTFHASIFARVHHAEMASLSPKRLRQTLHSPVSRSVAVTCGGPCRRAEKILSALRRGA